MLTTVEQERGGWHSRGDGKSYLPKLLLSINSFSSSSPVEQILVPCSLPFPSTYNLGAQLCLLWKRLPGEGGALFCLPHSPPVSPDTLLGVVLCCLAPVARKRQLPLLLQMLLGEGAPFCLPPGCTDWCGAALPSSCGWARAAKGFPGHSKDLYLVPRLGVPPCPSYTTV